MLTLTSHSGQVTGLAFSLDGRWLASAGWDGTVRLWDRPSYREVRRMRTTFDHAYCVAFSHDSSHVAAGFRNRGGFEGRRGYASFAWTPVVPVPGVMPNTIPAHDTRAPVGSATYFIAPHPHRNIVALHGASFKVTVWQQVGDDARELHHYEVPGMVEDLAYSSDGSVLAAVSLEGRGRGSISLWSMPRRAPKRLTIEEDEGCAIAFTPGGEALYCGFASGRLVWWNPSQNWTPQTALAAPGKIVDMAFSPDSRTLLLGCEDGLVRLWDVAAQRVRTTFDWIIGTIRCVAFAPDGLTAAVGGDGAILVWDVDE